MTQSGSLPPARPRRTNPITSFLTSMKVGVALLLVLTAACVVGTMIPQRQPLELYLQNYGPFFGSLIIRTSLEHVFGAWWFIGLAWLLGLSLAMCSWRRLKLLLRAKPEVEVSQASLAAMKDKLELVAAGSSDTATERLTGWLKGRGYRVSQGQADEATCLLAQKGSLSRWGTMLVHLSLLVIMIGAFYGNTPDIKGLWRSRLYDTQAGLLTGEKYTVTLQDDKPFQIELLGAERQGPAEMPTAYRSKLRIWQGERPVSEGQIELNAPFYYQGVSMTMLDYSRGTRLSLVAQAPGQAAQTIPGLFIDTERMMADPHNAIVDLRNPRLRLSNGWAVIPARFCMAVLGADSKIILGTDGEPRRPNPGETAVPAFSVGIVEKPGGKEAKLVDAGFVGKGGTLAYGGVNFTLKEEREVTGANLSLHRDAGLPIMYLGFGILMAGVMLAFYVSERTLRVRLWEDGGRVQVLAGARSRGLSSAEGELERLRCLFD